MLRLLFYQPINLSVSLKTPGILPTLSYVKKTVEIKYVTSRDDFIREVQKKEYDSIGVSITDMDLVGIIPQLNLAREIDTISPIIVGGPGVAGISNKLVRHNSIDICVEGEADNTLPLILQALGKKDYLPLSSEKAQQLKESYFLRDVGDRQIKVPLSDLSFSTEKGIKTIEAKTGNYSPAPTEEELNKKFSELPWDLILKQRFPAVSLYAQRGCLWGKCNYCQNMFGTNIRRYSINNVIRLIKETKQQGINSFIFLDDMLNSSKFWVSELITKITENNLTDMNYYAEVRVDGVDLELIKQLYNAGFKKLTAGLETILPNRALRLKKTNDPNRYISQGKRFVDACATIGVNTTLFMLWTDPDSTLLEISQEFREISELCLEVYQKHGRLPLFSSSTFEIFPLRDTTITKERAHEFIKIELSDGTTINQPTTFEKRPEVEHFIQKTDAVRVRKKEDFCIPGETSGYLSTYETNWNTDITTFSAFQQILNGAKLLETLYETGLYFRDLETSREIIRNILASNINFSKILDLKH